MPALLAVRSTGSSDVALSCGDDGEHVKNAVDIKFGRDGYLKCSWLAHDRKLVSSDEVALSPMALNQFRRSQLR
jgi:hypothetical protein